MDRKERIWCERTEQLATEEMARSSTIVKYQQLENSGLHRSGRCGGDDKLHYCVSSELCSPPRGFQLSPHTVHDHVSGYEVSRSKLVPY